MAEPTGALTLMVPDKLTGPGTEDLARCTKKPKTHGGDSCNDSNMEVPAEPSILRPDALVSPTVGGSPTSGLPRSFADTLRQDHHVPEPTHFYMGDDDEEKYPGVDELFNSQKISDDLNPSMGPKLELSKEKYISLFKPWRGALFIKLLGKSVSFRVMQQRTTSLWNLPKGCELIDLEGGYYVVRFFSREDYFHVLEGGPRLFWCIILQSPNGGIISDHHFSILIPHWSGSAFGNYPWRFLTKRLWQIWGILLVELLKSIASQWRLIVADMLGFVWRLT